MPCLLHAGGDSMLILTRYIGQSVVIDDGAIVVTILEVDDGRVKLGIIAPNDAVVPRQAFYDKRRGMVVLTLQTEETLALGNNIKVMILQVYSYHAKLGIEAPGLTIDREEIHDQKKERYEKPMKP